MIELKCPHCASDLRIEEQYAGQEGRCNKCGGSIIVPPLAVELDDPGSAFRQYSSAWKLEGNERPFDGSAQQLAAVGKTNRLRDTSSFPFS